jgi:aminoglycoside/choline kinase family phosphotransferase
MTAPLAFPPPAPPDHSLLARTLSSRLPGGPRLLSVAPLAGDASNRRYFRLMLHGPPGSVILMQLASPEAFKQSEEAVTGAVSVSELPFLNVLKHLKAVDLPVPTLYHYDETAGLLYLEDFGDLTLAEAAGKAAPADVRALYRMAIDILIRMHARASRRSSDCIAFARSFDVPLLMWEFDHFLEYGVVARRGTMKPEDAHAVRSVFQSIAEHIAKEPPIFTHRDYHSRNLMVDERGGTPRLGIIDFQDALLGPASYDLASLLRDAYIELDETLIDELIAVYLDGMASAAGYRPDALAFRRLFDFTSIQRNLKAAGRFVYIDRVKGNPKFLADIPRVLGYVRRNLDRYPELNPLREHLVPYVPELQ